MNKSVQWKWIPGYENRYEVSNDGQVRSYIDHKKTTKKPQMVMSLIPNGSGYLQVGLRSSDGKKKRLYVHRLVLLAFVSQPQKCQNACHNDGNPSNNNLENLRWATQKENMADKAKHGTLLRGEDNNRAVLTESQVRNIHKQISNGWVSMSKIAEEFGVSVTAIFGIKSGKTWKHLNLPTIKRKGRFSDEQRQEIRNRYAAGNVSGYQLAKEFNTSQATIRRIIKQ